MIVRDRRVLTTGYNGAPSGLTHCTGTTCLRAIMDIPSGRRLDICRGVHAEMNAVLQAALHGISTAGGVLYCTNKPCLLCTKVLINAGIEAFVVAEDYPDELADPLRSSAGIPLVVLSPEDGERRAGG